MRRVAIAEESIDHLDRTAGGMKRRVLPALFSFEGMNLALATTPQAFAATASHCL